MEAILDQEAFKDLDPVKILDTCRVLGLAFLLAFFVYKLIRNEKGGRGTYAFMGFCLLLCIIGIAAEWLDQKKIPRSEVERMIKTNTLALDTNHMEQIARLKEQDSKEIAQLKDVLFRMVRGQISRTFTNGAVGRTFDCDGTVSDLSGNFHFWLAVEIRGSMWPKEKELQVDKGQWKGRIFEDGANDGDIIELGLWVANDDAEHQIQQWLADCKQSGRYKGFPGHPGFSRLDRIDDLHFSKAVNSSPVVLLKQ